MSPAEYLLGAMALLYLIVLISEIRRNARIRRKIKRTQQRFDAIHFNRRMGL